MNAKRVDSFSVHFYNEVIFTKVIDSNFKIVVELVDLTFVSNLPFQAIFICIYMKLPGPTHLGHGVPETGQTK